MPLKIQSHSHEEWKAIVKVTWPAFVELVMSTLFGMVDMMMVGRVSPAAITAVGLTNQPFMIFLSVFAAVNVGATTLVAWNIGGHHLKDARAVARQVLVLNLIMGTIMSIIGIMIARPVVVFMGANAETIDMAVQYFRIVAGGLVFQTIVLGITAVLRGAGETKIPMLYNVGSNLFNVFGNYVLIYGKLGFPALGVAGAALSTTIARLIACLIGLYTIYYSRKSIITLSFKADYRLNVEIVKKIFSIGLPSAMEQFVMQSGLMLFARTVSGLGTNTFAAHQIGLNINGLAFSPSQAFGVAATTLVGQSLGAHDEKKAEKFANSIHHMAVGVACFVGFIFILFSHQLARIYTTDLVVAGMAGLVLKISALAQPGQSTQLSLAGALRGAGDTMYPLFASAIGIWCFRVILAYIFVYVFHWGLIGAWVSLLLDQYTRSLIIYSRYRSGKWKYVKVRFKHHD